VIISLTAHTAIRVQSTTMTDVTIATDISMESITNSTVESVTGLTGEFTSSCCTTTSQKGSSLKINYIVHR